MEYLPLRVNGEEFEGRPDNTSLFTFAGEAALYDHCFLELQRTDGQAMGRHIFKVIEKEAYDYIASHIKRQHYPQHLNMLNAPQCDRDAFDAQAFHDLIETNGVPEGWSDGTSE